MKICLWCGGALPKGRRKYCSNECADLFFIHNIAPLWWNNARRIALSKANNTCERCGRIGQLEVHHIIPLDIGEARHNSPKNKRENLQVLCRPCHEKEHHPNANHITNQIPREQMVFNLEILS